MLFLEYKIEQCVACSQQPAWQASEGEGKGKDARVKREKIGRGRITVPSLSRALF